MMRDIKKLDRPLVCSVNVVAHLNEVCDNENKLNMQILNHHCSTVSVLAWTNKKPTEICLE